MKAHLTLDFQNKPHLQLAIKTLVDNELFDFTVKKETKNTVTGDTYAIHRNLAQQLL